VKADALPLSKPPDWDRLLRFWREC
jgi:hypothetical protein